MIRFGKSPESYMQEMGAEGALNAFRQAGMGPGIGPVMRSMTILSRQEFFSVQERDVEGDEMEERRPCRNMEMETKQSTPEMEEIR